MNDSGSYVNAWFDRRGQRYVVEVFADEKKLVSVSVSDRNSRDLAIIEFRAKYQVGNNIRFNGHPAMMRELKILAR